MDKVVRRLVIEDSCLDKLALAGGYINGMTILEIAVYIGVKRPGTPRCHKMRELSRYLKNLGYECDGLEWRLKPR